MKKLISIFSFILILGVVSVSAQCCAGASKDKTNCSGKVQSDSTVKAYYFHATRRCATCEAVEKVTKEALTEYYGNKITFEAINREKDKDNPLIKKHKVSGQTLLILKGDKVVNLTNFAFMNARTKPKKLKAKIKATVDSMI